MSEKKRLIEVLMPLEQASILSPREKNVRSGGYISTFHVWPARRPLAACRAALLATLLPDPGDAAARAELLDAIGGKITLEDEESTDSEGNLVVEQKARVKGGVLAWNAEDSPFMESLRQKIRDAHGGKAPQVFDPFSGGGAIPYEALWLGCHSTASDLNPVAWLLLKGTLEYPQKYAGKKWPLPEFVTRWADFIEDFLSGGRKRRAPDAHFTEPRQIVLKGMLEGDLRWHIRAWGRWVLDKARADLTKYYPVINGEPTVAYLWARTCRDVQTEGRIPLLKTFTLCRKKGKRIALLPVPDNAAKKLTFKLLTEEQLSTSERRAIVLEDNPFLAKWGVTADTLEEFLTKGTMTDAGVWSPFGSGRPEMLALNMKEIREQGQRGLFGIQMTAVCVETPIPGKTNAVKTYRAPTAEDLSSADVQEEQIEELFESVPYGLIDEPLPPQGSLGFRVQLYGIVNWKQVFAPRQLLAAGVFLKYTRQAIAQLRENDPEHAEALAVYLTAIFGRFIDYCSQQCRWEPKDGEIKDTMSGYKLPMVWDFAEANPLSTRDRYYAGGIRGVSDAVGAFMLVGAQAPDTPTVRCVSSLATELNGQDLCFTDPPYYDAIPYADLMNFFRIWQKRIMGDFNPEFKEVFERESPTWDASKGDGELIDDNSRHGGDTEKSRQVYEDGMAKAFSRSLAALKPDGRMVVVFANKEVDAWQCLIAALIRSGAVVTASWPIQTEMVNKITQKRANLSTSVWIVCSKRDTSALPGWEEPVLKQMRTQLLSPRDELGGKNVLRYFFDLHVRGADFLWAALGPALTVFSAHPYVKKTGGGVLSVKEFLDEVRKLVLHFALGALKGFDDLQTASEKSGFVLDPVTQYYLLHREAFGFDPVLAGVCILYANACGKTDRELQMAWHILEQGGKNKAGKKASKRRKAARGDEELLSEEPVEEETEVLNSNSKADKYCLVRWDQRVSEEDLGENKGSQTAPLIDKLHRLMYLLQQNRGSDVQTAYDKWGLAGDPAFPRVLQAVRELALEDHNTEEKRLVESLASQLRMNRKLVGKDNSVIEMPFFTEAAETEGKESV
jgi:adenine-specific DNA methylase